MVDASDEKIPAVHHILGGTPAGQGLLNLHLALEMEQHCGSGFSRDFKGEMHKYFIAAKAAPTKETTRTPTTWTLDLKPYTVNPAPYTFLTVPTAGISVKIRADNLHTPSAASHKCCTCRSRREPRGRDTHR